MPASITTSTTFEYVRLVGVDGNPEYYTIYWADTDGTEGNLVCPGKLPADPSDDLDNLEVLQEIYGGDGFVDDADVTVTVVLEGTFPAYISTVEDLSEHSLWNPFDADGWTRYQEVHKHGGLFGQGLARIQKTTTGRTELLAEYSEVPQKGTPPGSEHPYSFVDTEILTGQPSASQVRFFIYPADTSDEAETDAEFNALAAAVWMRAFFDEYQTSGDDVGDGLLPESGFTGNRVYEYEDEEFTVESIERFDDDDGKVSRVEITIEATTAQSTLDYGLILFNLRTKTYDLTSSDIEVEPVRGAYNVRHRVKALNFSNFFSIIRHEGVPCVFMEDGNRMTLVPMIGNIGLQRDYNTLTVPGDGVRRFPTHYGANEIHFDSTSDATLRMGDLFDYLPSGGLNRFFTVHNRSARANGGELTFEDADGNDFFILYPEEYVTVRVTIDSFGNREVILQNIPDRFCIHSDAGLGNQNLAFWTDSGASNSRLRWLRHATANETLHTDAFRLGTGTLPSAASQGHYQNYNTGSDPWNLVGSVEMRMAGELFLELNYSLAMTASQSGQISNNNGIRIFILNAAGTTFRQIWNGTRTQWGGASAVRQFNPIRLEDNVAVGERILFFFKYNNNGTSIAWGDTEVEDYSRLIRLKPRVELEMT